MKKKVYPNFTGSSPAPMRRSSSLPEISGKVLENNGNVKGGEEEVALTVWKKSLLLNCKGFTVFNGKGNLVFRVDNYVASNKSGQILLMDAVGKPLLTIRRKKLSWGDKWLIYQGEESSNPKYLAQKQSNLLNSNFTKNTILANLVTLTSSQIQNPNDKNKEIKISSPRKADNIVYQMEGSYAKRSVLIYDNKRQCVAEIRRKESVGGVVLGGDVFRLLIIRPNDIDIAMAMTLVILLDQMFVS